MLSFSGDQQQAQKQTPLRLDGEAKRWDYTPKCFEAEVTLRVKLCRLLENAQNIASHAATCALAILQYAVDGVRTCTLPCRFCNSLSLLLPVF